MSDRYPKLSEKIHSERNWLRCKDDWVAHAVELEQALAEARRERDDWRGAAELLGRRIIELAKPAPAEPTPPEPPREPRNEAKTCWCYSCLDQPEHGFANPVMQRMILCPDCGNKRCPRATHHIHACTNSNEPGQPGSRYYTGASPREPAPCGHASAVMVERDSWMCLDCREEGLARVGGRLVAAKPESATCLECGGTGDIKNGNDAMACGRCGGSGKDPEQYTDEDSEGCGG